jgi:hypothetical protein
MSGLRAFDVALGQQRHLRARASLGLGETRETILSASRRTALDPLSASHYCAVTASMVPESTRLGKLAGIPTVLLLMTSTT